MGVGIIVVHFVPRWLVELRELGRVVVLELEQVLLVERVEQVVVDMIAGEDKAEHRVVEEDMVDRAVGREVVDRLVGAEQLDNPCEQDLHRLGRGA